MFSLNDYIYEDLNPKKLILGSFPAIHQFPFSLKEAFIDPQKIAAIALRFNSMYKLDFIRTITDLTFEGEVFGQGVDFPTMAPPAIKKPIFSSIDQLTSVTPDIKKSRFSNYLESYRIIKSSTDTPLIASLTGPLTILGSIVDYQYLMKSLRSNKIEEVEAGLEIIVNTSLELIYKLNQIKPEILMISDPIASFLSPSIFKEVLIPKYNILFDTFLGCNILHICGNISPLLPAVKNIRAQGLSVDENVNIKDALFEIPQEKILFGNISPIKIMANGNINDVKKEMARLLSLWKSHPNLVPSTGCTLPHFTPEANIQAFLSQG